MGRSVATGSFCFTDDREALNSEGLRLTMAIVEQESGETKSRGGRSRRRADDGDGRDGVKRCGMWLPSKRRFCASYALPSSVYCGNHDHSGGKTRVPCPVDPSHTILQKEIASHVKKCQATKHIKFSEEQPYYRKGVNAGSDREEEEEIVPMRGGENAHQARQFREVHTPEPAVEIGKSNELTPTECPSENGSSESSNASEKKQEGVRFQSSAAKRAAITALSEAEFQNLVRRIEYSYEACTRDEPTEESFLQPPQCLQWWDQNRDRRLPFQEKHVSQQASMLGNLEAFGLLVDSNNNEEASKLEGASQTRAYVEFGAGRGYLSQMLCDSYGVSSVVLVERKAYKYKADRTLRQLAGVSIERLRTDIEDLYINGVQSLQRRRYVAVSKHLCGPATDMTLRCCLKDVEHSSSKQSDQQRRDSCPTLEGVGIATCCHHLCQWKSYVNKQFFRGFGFSEAEFHMISWLTSWAVSESGDHAEVEDSAEVKVGQQTAATVEISFSTDIARPCLTETMDGMDVVARAELGRKCKHMIDFGRLLFVRLHGLEAKIVKYISPSVSPENKLLLARNVIV